MATQPPAQVPEDEFAADQNSLISDLAKKMHLVGVMMLIFGIFGAVIGAITLFTPKGGLGALIQGVIVAFLGNWTVQASDSFARIVRTQGHDMHHLMDALASLRKYYGLKYAII